MTQEDIQELKNVVNSISEGWCCTPQQQLPYEAGKAAGIQMACTKMLKYLESLENEPRRII